MTQAQNFCITLGENVCERNDEWMQLIDKLHSVFILAAVGLGLLIGQVEAIALVSDRLIIPFLMLMLYGLFLTTPLRHVRKVVDHRKLLRIAVLINFVWTPLLAWGLGAVFLAETPALWIGLIMLLVTPCTDWVLAFTKVAKGNMAVATSLIPINLVLQVLLLPLYLWGFTGSIEAIPIGSLIESILLVLVVPFGLASLSNRLWKNRERFQTVIIPFFEHAQFYSLLLAITAMFASLGRHMLTNGQLVLQLLVPLLSFFAINFVLGWIVSRGFSFSYADRVALTMTIIARNSPLALAVAVIAFPHMPMIALVLVIGPLIELPLLTLVSQVVMRSSQKGSLR